MEGSASAVLVVASLFCGVLVSLEGGSSASLAVEAGAAVGSLGVEVSLTGGASAAGLGEEVGRGLESFTSFLVGASSIDASCVGDGGTSD